MKIELKPELKTAYPEATFGSLIVSNVLNMKKHDRLEERKREFEREIREIDLEKDNIIKRYNAYFRSWGKTYPIEFQIKTIKNGGRFPQVSVLVDSMFIAELKNRILTSGHDLDSIQGNLAFEVSRGGEKYVMLNGKEQGLKKNDIILKDEDGILASVLYGPARRTSISLETKNVLYIAWCPYRVDEELIEEHLNSILSNLRIAFESPASKTQIHR
ncbi:MAG: phenylalanine--tRNA ligase beta subunit-related protein [Candidatus Bathyarchaeia archaeon]